MVGSARCYNLGHSFVLTVVLFLVVGSNLDRWNLLICKSGPLVEGNITNCSERERDINECVVFLNFLAPLALLLLLLLIFYSLFFFIPTSESGIELDCILSKGKENLTGEANVSIDQVHRVNTTMRSVDHDVEDVEFHPRRSELSSQMPTCITRFKDYIM